MPYKVSAIFEQAGGRAGGWTVTFWNLFPSLAAVKDPANALWNGLDALTGAQVYSNYLRVANSGPPHDSILYYDPTDGPKPISSNYPDTDIAPTALQLTCRSADGYQSHVWLHGAPDSVVSNAGRYTPDGLFVQRLNALVKLLTTAGNGWCIYAQDKSKPHVPIKSVSPSGVVTTLSPHGFDAALPPPVRVSRVSGIDGVNKVWQKIQVIDNTSFQLINWTLVPLVPSDQGSGKCWVVSKLTKPIETVVLVRATKHDVGRPFGAWRGRRPRKVLNA